MIAESDFQCRFGQMHVRRLAARGEIRHAPLICLHPSPHSGAFFATVMPLLNAGREVIAPDYPGYGDSAPPPSPPSITDYAAAVLNVLSDMNVATVDAFGFHTGCLVGVDMALLDAERIRRLVLVDVPYYVGAERDDLYARAVDRNKLGSDRSKWGFHAAFTYASDEKFPALETPVTAIATQSSLLDATRAASGVTPACRLVERPDITRPVFEKHAENIAAEIRGALE